MIKDILINQKAEIQGKLSETYIKRKTPFKGIDNHLIKVITGPRRSGKSFFTLHELHNSGIKFGYINFDDENLDKVENYDDYISAVKNIYGDVKVLFFDEIQNLDRWELFVNRLQRQNFKIILTGSNSKLLSRELATHLTGRHIEIRMYPFSFAEIIDSYSNEITGSEIKDSFYNYLDNGGYPEPFLTGIEAKNYLKSLFDSLIYTDIIRRYKIRLSEGIHNLSTYLISNIAKEYSNCNLTKVTSCKSSHTVEKYVNFLQEAFLFFSVPRFSYKAKEILTNNKKIYTIDNGFINAKGNMLTRDTGRKLENLLAIDLFRKSYEEDFKLYYWKSERQEEVDFLIHKFNKVEQLIQVSLNIESVAVLSREIRALINASNALGCNNLTVITGDYEATKKMSWNNNTREINFIPAYKWLLNK